MRIRYLAAFLLIACGGKIATESTGSTTGKPIGANGDDDDDPPVSSSGVSSSGYYGTTSGYYGTSGTSGYSGSSSDCISPNLPHCGASSGYGSTSSGYTSSGYSSSSSGGTLCGQITGGCAGTETDFKCSINGPPGTPSISCYGATGQPMVKCTCYDAYDAGPGDTTFVVKVTKTPTAKDLYDAWQKKCGGSCL